MLSNPIIIELDEAITSAIHGATISPRSEYNRPEAIERHVAKFKVLGIETIDELEAELRHRRLEVLAFATEWITPGAREHSFSPGIGLFYLAYLLAAATHDEKTVKQFLAVAKIQSEHNNDELAKELIKTYDLIYEQRAAQ